jgi:hypothetical protein
MADDTKQDVPSFDPPKSVRRRIESTTPSGKVTISIGEVSAWVLLDIVGPDAIPPHAQATIVMSIPGHVDLVLFPGFNRVIAQTWTAYESHPGVTVRLPAAADVEDPDPLAGDIVPLAEMPRRATVLVELIGRTYSSAGLDAIEESEMAATGKNPRGIVVTALTKQRAAMAKRSKPVNVEVPVKPKRRGAR